MTARTIGDGKAEPGVTHRDDAASGKGQSATRVLGFAAVWLGMVALAAATFVLSYSGIHHLALQAGVAPRLARGYPLVVDAMLVVVLAAVLSLRGAGLPSKLFAWATLVVVLAAAASADALHAAGRKLPDHVAAVTVAIVPWVLVFLAFALLLAMLRYARVRRHADTATVGATTDAATVDARPAVTGIAEPAAAAEPTTAGPATAEPATAEPATTEPAESEPPESGQPVLAVPRQPGPTAVADADPAFTGTAAFTATAATAATGVAQADADGPLFTDEPELAIDSDPGEDDPSSDEAAEDEPGMPVFHRMWSSPTPPSGM